MRQIGVSKWIMLSEIQSRKFGDETGEFLLELSLGNIMTIFETDLQLSSGGPPKSGKFESGSFSFGSFDWNVSIVVHNYAAGSGNAAPNSTNDNGPAEENISGRIIYVFLNRLSGFDHPCRVQYRIIIGEGKNREDSGMLDQISDAGGRIRGFQMQHSLMDYLKPTGSVRVHVELHCCNAISEAKVPVVRNPSPAVNCYDRNKQGWCIEADLDSEFLRLKLFFMDLHSVPRNHLRYISWIAYVIVKEPRHGGRESLAVTNAPHSNYYIQDGIDMGAMMDTTLPVAKIKDQPKIYLEGDNKLTVHVEWCDSIMLFNHIYHKYDDITRIHSHQMRREISALSSENYSLEKQLISYQKSVGGVPARSASKDNSSETGSVRGTQHHAHLAQRSSSEVLLNDHSRSSSNANTNQVSVGQSIVNHASGSHGQFQSAGQVNQAHHTSIERRSVGSGGSGSMLGLPSSATSSGPTSPLHSPLGNTRNFHHSFHNPMPRGGSLHRADYHHQLPAIPAQVQSGGGTHHQVHFHHGSPQMKARANHYGSLQMNSLHDSLYDEEEYQSSTSSQTCAVGNLTPPRLTRSAHRSRERSTYQQAPLVQQQAIFGVTSYSQSLTGSHYHQAVSGGQLPPPQAYPVPPHSPVPVGMLNATNGWTNHGTKLISPGFYEHL